MTRLSMQFGAWWTAHTVRLASDEGAEFLEVALWSLAILGVGAALVGIFQTQLEELFKQIKLGG